MICRSLSEHSLETSLLDDAEGELSHRLMVEVDAGGLERFAKVVALFPIGFSDKLTGPNEHTRTHIDASSANDNDFVRNHGDHSEQKTLEAALV